MDRKLGFTCPPELVNLPAGHAVQLLLPLIENVPAPQLAEQRVTPAKS